MEQRFSNIEECNDYIEFLEIKGRPIPEWVLKEKERNKQEGYYYYKKDTKTNEESEI